MSELTRGREQSIYTMKATMVSILNEVFTKTPILFNSHNSDSFTA